MNQQQVNTLLGYGTSEGVTKAWDTRGRSGKTASRAELKKTFMTEKHALSHASRLAKKYGRTFGYHLRDVGADNARPYGVHDVANKPQFTLEIGRATARGNWARSRNA